MAQNEQKDSGFSLPAAKVDTGNSSTTPVTVIVPPGGKFEGTYVVNDTSSRDLLVGGGVLLVLFIAFFLAKNAYANTLVAKRVPPSKANAAGWWLFVFLASIASGAVLGVVSLSTLLSPIIIGSLALIGIVALILMLLTART